MIVFIHGTSGKKSSTVNLTVQEQVRQQQFYIVVSCYRSRSTRIYLMLEEALLISWLGINIVDGFS